MTNAHTKNNAYNYIYNQPGGYLLQAKANVYPRIVEIMEELERSGASVDEDTLELLAECSAAVEELAQVLLTKTPVPDDISGLSNF